jgi:DNA-directed RNA polymerase subunit RPC12/RpoP
MTKLISAKCPNCGAILELPEKLDRAFCMHCGGKVIIGEHIYQKSKIIHGFTIVCPECWGKGYVPCNRCYGSGSGRYTGCGKEHKYKKGVLKLDYSSKCTNGLCPVCQGKGKTVWLEEKCDYCHGSKFCNYCGGRCIDCNGSGKIQCFVCKGSGFREPDR